jgi:AhpD family alkylhydroperoxidase
MGFYYGRKRDPEALGYFNEGTMEAWKQFNIEVFKEGQLTQKTKELVAVACAYITRCPYCIEGHAKKALDVGATKEEMGEVIAIAAALSAGASMAHRNIALDVEG